MLRQAVVAAGGKGERLGALAKKHGNKSLIPIEGLPILAYTLEWLKKAGVEEIIISVNYMEEYRTIERLFGNDPQITMAYNRYRTSSAQCILPLQPNLDDRFLFVYGHAPSPSEHLQHLASITNEGVVVSLYPTTTQQETKKPAKLLGRSVTLEEDGSLFIEPPHVLTTEFVSLLIKTESWKSSFRKYQGLLMGVRANYPSEFHYRENFLVFREFMAKLLKNKK